MSWKDRAQPITPEIVDKPSWKSRAVTETSSETPPGIPTESSYVQGFFKSYKKDKPRTLLQKADIGVNKATKFGLDALNAPFEAVGEAITAPLENRMPIRPTVLGGEGAANPFSTVNKLLRAGAGALSGIPGGTPMESARTAYNAPRGGMGVAEDTAMALLMGKVAPKVAAAPIDAATVGAQKLVKGAGSLASGITKKAIRTTLGPSEEAQSALFNRPEAIKSATDTGPAKIADDIQSGHQVVTEKINSIEEEVSKVLRPSPYLMEGATPKENVLKVISDVRKGIGFNVGPQQKYVKGILDEVSDNLSRLRNTVSEVQMRDIVQKVRESIKFGKKEYGSNDLALMKVSAKLDGMLKKNLDYKELMKKEVPLQRLKVDLEDNWGLKRSVGEGFIATDATASKLKNVLGETKEVKSQKTLESLSKETGVDYLQKVKDNKMAGEFKAGAKPQGSRRVNMGRAVGGALGGLISLLTGGSTGTTIASAGGGAAIGGYGAGAADYYGGPMAKGIIQMLSKGKTGTGNVLSAINAKTQGTPLQAVLQKLLEGQPIMAPLLSGNR